MEMGGAATVEGERLNVTDGEGGLTDVVLLELESHGGSKGDAEAGASVCKKGPFEVAMRYDGEGRSFTSFSAKVSSIWSYLLSSIGLNGN